MTCLPGWICLTTPYIQYVQNIKNNACKKNYARVIKNEMAARAGLSLERSFTASVSKVTSICSIALIRSIAIPSGESLALSSVSAGTGHVWAAQALQAAVENSPAWRRYMLNDVGKSSRFLPELNSDRT
jgi:hypothetical protein